jgi:hypothetical protein
LSRLLLQIGKALLALIPIATGIVTMLGAEAPVLDSNLLELLGAPLFIYWQCRLAQSGATP